MAGRRMQDVDSPVRPRPPKYIIPPEIDQDELIREFTSGALGRPDPTRATSRKRREEGRRDSVGSAKEAGLPSAPQYAGAPGAPDAPDGSRLVRLAERARGRDVFARRLLAVLAALFIIAIPVRSSCFPRRERGCFVNRPVWGPVQVVIWVYFVMMSGNVSVLGGKATTVGVLTVVDTGKYDDCPQPCPSVGCVTACDLTRCVCAWGW